MCVCTRNHCVRKGWFYLVTFFSPIPMTWIYVLSLNIILLRRLVQCVLFCFICENVSFIKNPSIHNIELLAWKTLSYIRKDASWNFPLMDFVRTSVSFLAILFKHVWFVCSVFFVFVLCILVLHCARPKHEWFKQKVYFFSNVCARMYSKRKKSCYGLCNSLRWDYTKCLYVVADTVATMWRH